MELSNGVYFYPYEKSQETHRQNAYAKNEMSVFFQVVDSDGVSITNLNANDFIVRENGIPISTSNLSWDTPSNGVDIVFVIDETNSMSGIINSVKANVRAFVSNLSSKSLKSNLCLVTFRDTVTRICSNFVEDIPSTLQNENSEDFLEKLNTIEAIGGGDIPENQLDGIQQAALQTPWHNGYQRAIIMITEAPFHYAPEYLGDAGDAAPYYENVVDLIQSQQIMTFTLAKNGVPGYTSGFKGRPSLSESTGAEHFDIQRVISDASEMNKIFGVIAERLATKYTIRYTAEDNGLDPTLPLSERNITVTLKNPIPGASVRITSRSSSYPSGVPQQNTRWTLNPPFAIASASLEVWMNGSPSPISYSLNGGDLVFASAPPPGAEILAKYEFADLRNNVKIFPIFTKPTPDYYTFKTKFNGIPTDPEHVRITQTPDGKNMIEPQDCVFDNADPFKIRTNGGLFVSFEMIPF